jgi:hypothetical protein
MARPAAMRGNNNRGTPVRKDAITGNLCQRTDTTIRLNPLPSARLTAR